MMHNGSYERQGGYTSMISTSTWNLLQALEITLETRHELLRRTSEAKAFLRGARTWLLGLLVVSRE